MGAFSCTAPVILFLNVLTLIEQDGTKLYVPVESPTPGASPSLTTQKQEPQSGPDDDMQLDDTKHKVYIYNIDDELSSDSESEADGKLVFLPDIEKRLRDSRIPPSVLANQDGELAGMQLVLYSDPKSLSVPEEKDGVRKAIIEARRRLREGQAPDVDAQAIRDSDPTTKDVATGTASHLDADGDIMDMD